MTHENSLKNLQKFQPGVSGNPHGRPRTRLSDRFVQDLASAWEKHGPKILESLAKKDPRFFADLAARLVPKDVQVSLQQQTPGNLSPADWSSMLALLEGIKTALPDDQRSPQEIAAFVGDAIRAHGATLIEHAPNGETAANTDKD